VFQNLLKCSPINFVGYCSSDYKMWLRGQSDEGQGQRNVIIRVTVTRVTRVCGTATVDKCHVHGKTSNEKNM